MYRMLSRKMYKSATYAKGEAVSPFFLFDIPNKSFVPFARFCKEIFGITCELCVRVVSLTRKRASRSSAFVASARLSFLYLGLLVKGQNLDKRGERNRFSADFGEGFFSFAVSLSVSRPASFSNETFYILRISYHSHGWLPVRLKSLSVSFLSSRLVSSRRGGRLRDRNHLPPPTVAAASNTSSQCVISAITVGE